MAEDIKPPPTAAQAASNEAGSGEGGNSPPGGAALPAAGAAPGAQPQPGTPPAGNAWPENWRETVAKDDPATLNRLKRYQDPAAALGALSQLQERISKGELRGALPKNATPEQMKAWRDENGIPEDPKGYDLTMPNGAKVDLEERPDIGSFLEFAHKAGYSQSQVKAALEWNAAYRDEETSARNEMDTQIMRDATDALRKEWGDGYYANMNRVHQILDSGPSGMKEALLNGRMADGTPIGSHPEVLKWLVGRSVAEDPSGTILNEQGTSRLTDVEARIQEIEKTMRTNRTAYNRDESMQTELRTLYEARSQLQSRAR